MIALFPLPAKRDELRLAFSFERTLIISLFILISILPNLSKFGGAVDTENGSPFGPTIWTLLYLGALVRLYTIRAFTSSYRSARLLYVLIALALVSTFWSSNLFVTLRNSVELGGTVLIGFYLATRFEPRDFLRLLCLALFTLTVVSIGFQAVDGDGLSVAWSGVFSEKNHFGGTMVIGAITFLIASIDASARLRQFFVVGFVFSVFCVVKSTSVTSLFILSLSIALLVLVMTWRRFRLPPFPLLVAIGFVVCVAWIGSSFLDVPSIIASLGKNATLTGRTDIWPILWSAIWQKPLLGYGFNGYFAPNGPADDLFFIVGWRPYHAHNSFIQMGTSLGFIGLGLFVAIVAIGFWRSVVLAVRGKVADLWPFSVIAYLTMVSSTETYLGVQNSIEMILFAAALIYASPVRTKDLVR